ncbi:hypothetical protein HHK36_025304 [Tetracentron sinense]|uniref:C2 domain-containing protein n=1 Tax=Tetracentron sinense TaxID=13715 RepID=A0A834YPU2_TETSI|nr:hypothetical protein HHK36_025304 [Tetracentron sinense]
MESSSIELKVISCKDLKSFNFFQKLSVYAVVSIVSDDPEKKVQQHQQQQQRTPIDKEGDGNLEWNHQMRFDLKDISFLDCDHLFIEFNLRCGGIFGNKTIGEVRVPFKDLIDEFNGAIRYVSYQVRNTDGKPNGVLDFSYKVNDMDKKIGSSYPTNEITDVPAVYPSPDVHYPSPEIHYPSPEVHYPSLDVNYPSLEVHYPAPEIQYSSQQVYYPAPPPPPPPPPPLMGMGMTYPPPPPPPPPFVYPMAPVPYGGPGGGYGYPGVGQSGVCDCDTLRKGLQAGGDSFPGYWNVR